MIFIPLDSISMLQYSLKLLMISYFNLASEHEFDSDVSGEFGFIIKRVQEIIRPFISRGYPEYGLPILDPLRLDELDLETNNPEFGKHLLLRGLERFVIDRVILFKSGPTVAMNLTVAVNVTVPKLHVRGPYNLIANLGTSYHVYGVGQLEVIATNFHVFVKSSLSIKDAVNLTYLKLDFSHDDLIVHLGNFMNDSESGIIMNEVLRRRLPQIIESLKPEILPHLENFMIGPINNIIHEFEGSILDLFKPVPEPNPFSLDFLVRLVIG